MAWFGTLATGVLQALPQLPCKWLCLGSQGNRRRVVCEAGRFFLIGNSLSTQ